MNMGGCDFAIVFFCTTRLLKSRFSLHFYWYNHLFLLVLLLFLSSSTVHVSGLVLPSSTQCPHPSPPHSKLPLSPYVRMCADAEENPYMRCFYVRVWVVFSLAVLLWHWLFFFKCWSVQENPRISQITHIRTIWLRTTNNKLRRICAMQNAIRFVIHLILPRRFRRERERKGAFIWKSKNKKWKG